MTERNYETIIAAIAECDNACQAFGDTWEDYFGTMTDDEIAESIYKDAIRIADEYAGFGGREFRFEGKAKIKAEIKKHMRNAAMFPYMNTHKKIKRVVAVKAH